jgi:drug/metabolite transporter (DMT)-like permease
MGNRNLLFIHIAVLLFGLSGLFVRIIHQPASVIVLGRVFFSIIFLFIMIRINKLSIIPDMRSDYCLLIFAGIVLALHWTFFTKSIQISSVAIGTLTVATFPLFVAFVEPLVFKEKVEFESIICSIIMLVGVWFIIPEFKMGNAATQGVLYGMIGSVTYAVFSLINRKLIQKNNVIVISFYEQTVTAVVLLPFAFMEKPVFSVADAVGLAVLGIIFTAIAHSMFIAGFKSVKVYTAGIISSLEPIYGILAALVIFGELPEIKEIIGGIIILGVVLYSTTRPRKILNN